MTTDGERHASEVAHQPVEALASALEREHREIDDGLAAFMGGQGLVEQRREALQRAVRALRRHIYLEEELLFPQLRDAGLAVPVFVMLREHAQIWATLNEVERELGEGGGALGPCRRLAVELLHHNLKEEKVLYPRADAVLTASAADQLRTFLQTGEHPAGWVCLRYDPDRA